MMLVGMGTHQDLRHSTLVDISKADAHSCECGTDTQNLSTLGNHQKAKFLLNLLNQSRCHPKDRRILSFATPALSKASGDQNHD